MFNFLFGTINFKLTLSIRNFHQNNVSKAREYFFYIFLSTPCDTRS